MKFLLFVLIIVTIFALLMQSDAFEKNTANTLTIGETTIEIEIADDEAGQTLGLSGRTSLAENKGLLFVFKEESYHGIWMKDMNFPIDIAWLDKDKKIIHIEHSVSPDTYPKIFLPPTPDLFVLEVTAGFFNTNNIKVGDGADF